MTTTYTPLYTTTASSASSVTFNSISSAYTDLIAVIQVANSTNTDLGIRFNGDTGSHYSVTLLVGNGSSASSTKYSNQGEIYLDITGTSTGQMTYIVNIQNYANTSTYKTTLTRYSNAGMAAEASVGLWRGSTGSSTEAINSITIKNGVGTFSGTVSLYGVASATALATTKATGGDSIVTSGGYTYHVFRSSGTFTPSQSLSADVLVVAGGGAGSGGGGGAGGLQAFTSQSLTATGYTITIGGGGSSGAQGSNSQFGALTASVGGGYGGGYNEAGALPNPSGGSGGGGGGKWNTSLYSQPGGIATSGQGNNGGDGRTSNSVGLSDVAGGGGGGAGGAGVTATFKNGGAGGAGTNTYSTWHTATLTGVNGYIAGGGGGGGNTSGGVGGSGGGGAGTVDAGVNGVTNTGSGGGGGYNGGTGYSGGSGIVIVRYAV